MKIWIIIVVLLLLTVFCGIAPTSGTTSSENAKVMVGKIVDSLNKPIDSVLVRLQNTNNRYSSISFDTSVYTNANGEYTFNIPPAGLYFITARKDTAIIAFIDSIFVNDNSKKIIQEYKMGRPCSIQGTILLNGVKDSTNKIINVGCVQLHFEKEYNHKQTFVVSSIPHGTYTFVFTPRSQEYLPKTIAISVESGENKVIDKVILEKKNNDEFYTRDELKALVIKLAANANVDPEKVNQILGEAFFNAQWKKSEPDKVKNKIEEAIKIIQGVTSF